MSDWFKGACTRGAVYSMTQKEKPAFDAKGGSTGWEPVAMVAMWNKSLAWIPFSDAFSTPLAQVDLNRIWMSVLSWWA